MTDEPNIPVRGRTFTLRIISAKMRKTAVGELERRHYIKKYERYEKRRTRLKVHNPESINAQEGDLVVVRECRPISKTKKFIIVEKVDEGTKGKSN